MSIIKTVTERKWSIEHKTSRSGWQRRTTRARPAVSRLVSRLLRMTPIRISKTRVQNKLLSNLDVRMDVTKTSEVRKTIQDLFDQILNEENIVLSRPERARLFEQIAAEILGFGPLQPFLEDDSVTEIMVNGAKNIYVERRG